MKVVYLILLFLVFSGIFLVISNQNINLLDKNDRSLFADYCKSWSVQAFSNVKSISSYVINLDWTPDLSTKTSQQTDELD